jgi:hypothetical protein
MKPPGMVLGCVLSGIGVQAPAIMLLAFETMNMHNGYSALLCAILPFVAIADRLKDPPVALVAAVATLSLVQFPAYGFAIGKLWSKGRPLLALAAVALVHGIAAGAALALRLAHY